MRIFILKTSVVTIAIYLLYHFTIGHHIRNFSSQLNIISSQHERIKIKDNILKEMKKGSEKENIFDEEERVIISNFIKKILSEINYAK